MDHLLEGRAIKEISEDTGASRNTVSQWVHQVTSGLNTETDLAGMADDQLESYAERLSKMARIVVVGRIIDIANKAVDLRGLSSALKELKGAGDADQGARDGATINQYFTEYVNNQVKILKGKDK